MLLLGNFGKSKNMIRIILILFLFPFSCLGQDIPKFSNTIYVKNVSFASAKNALLDIGYFIDQQNEQDGTIITKEINADKDKMFGVELNRYVMIIYVRIKDSIGKISAQMSFTDGNKREWSTVEYWKLRTSVPHSLFLIIDKYAHSIGSEITYAKL